MQTHGLRVLVPGEADRRLVPGEADRRLVHRVLFEELCAGVIAEASLQADREVIARLAAAVAEGVILGCTEIELLVGPADILVEILRTTRIHTEAAVAAATTMADQGGMPAINRAGAQNQRRREVGMTLLIVLAR
jgi:aspartate racemase